MVTGALALSHHLWLQTFMGRVRGVLETYLGVADATAADIGSDPHLVELMAAAEAEYEVTRRRDEVICAVRVAPPGTVSEVQVRVRTSSSAVSS
jgi:hypothetical protein